MRCSVTPRSALCISLWSSYLILKSTWTYWWYNVSPALGHKELKYKKGQCWGETSVFRDLPLNEGRFEINQVLFKKCHLKTSFDSYPRILLNMALFSTMYFHVAMDSGDELILHVFSTFVLYVLWCF